MMYVVIRPWGYMETVKKEDIGPKDVVMFTGTSEECNKYIHK